MKRLLASFFVLCSAWVCFAAQSPKGLSTAPLLAVNEIHASNLKLETAFDGTRYIAMRLRVDGAPAVRVYFSGLRLGLGQKLLVSNVDGTQVYGPFEGTGPTQSGEFWSPAVAGSELVIELQTGPDGVADLPFTIETIEAAEAAEAAPVAQHTSDSRGLAQSLYRGVPVTHEVIDGMAIYEGDIVLGPANELTAVATGTKDRVRSAVGITGQNYRWANATLPYVISADIPTPSRVTDAIAHWNTVMTGTVRMVPRTNETAYVSFVRPANAGTCSSYIGKTFSGSNPISVGDYCSKGNVIHEIGHAWGLWHEHTREDRNNYVTVTMANVQDGQTHNFTQNITNGDDIGVYDFNSIMHYNATAFSKNGLPTIVTIPAGIAIGQRSALSTGDIAGIKALYPSSTNPNPGTVVVTITSNPAAAAISADGVTYTTPATFTWNVGSVHTISALNTSGAAMRTMFAAWSDGGAQTHTVTASTAVTTFKVDYAVSYAVKAVATPVGSATAMPASVDTFYANGSAIALKATSPAGYCFTGWIGLIAGTPAQTSLVASRAYDLQATFQTGAINLTTPTLAAAASGGTYSTGVTATSGCMWTAVSTASWIKITSGASGSGSSTISFTVDPNATGAPRSGTITVEGQVYSVTQAAAVTQPVAASGAASFLSADTATSGAWKGVYGVDGFAIPNEATNYPSYVTVAPIGSQFTWAATTSDTRALQKGAAGATGSIASCWYHWSVVNFNLAFNDQNTHQVAIYFLDWDRQNRSAKVEVIDANNAVLDSRTISNFGSGQYLVWNLSGRVTIRVTNNNPNINFPVSGIFFGSGTATPAPVVSTPTPPPPPPPPPTPPAPSVAPLFAGLDTTTSGAWKGVYGADGFAIPNEATNYPSYVTVAPIGSQFTWAATTSDTRALQKGAAGATGSIASCWYHWSVVNFNLAFNDQNTHQVAIYFLDWDRQNRSAKVEVIDANNAVLDSRTISNFGSGQYLVWNLSGRVTIRVTNNNPSINFPVSGIFFR